MMHQVHPFVATQQGAIPQQQQVQFTPVAQQQPYQRQYQSQYPQQQQVQYTQQYQPQYQIYHQQPQQQQQPQPQQQQHQLQQLQQQQQQQQYQQQQQVPQQFQQYHQQQLQQQLQQPLQQQVAQPNVRHAPWGLQQQQQQHVQQVQQLQPQQPQPIVVSMHNMQQAPQQQEIHFHQHHYAAPQSARSMPATSSVFQKVDADAFPKAASLSAFSSLCQAAEAQMAQLSSSPVPQPVTVHKRPSDDDGQAAAVSRDKKPRLSSSADSESERSFSASAAASSHSHSNNPDDDDDSEDGEHQAVLTEAEQAEALENTDKPYLCRWGTCSDRFRDADLLALHVRGHIGNGRHAYSCEWRGCARIGREFSLLCNIVYHIQTHAKNACTSYSCKWRNCSAAFLAVPDLVSHLAEVHVARGKPDYACLWEGCGRNMRPLHNHSKIIEHLRTHTGEQPFNCCVPYCPKKFTKKSSVVGHVRRCHGFEAWFDDQQPSAEAVAAMARHQQLSSFAKATAKHPSADEGAQALLSQLVQQQPPQQAEHRQKMLQLQRTVSSWSDVSSVVSSKSDAASSPASMISAPVSESTSPRSPHGTGASSYSQSMTYAVSSSAPGPGGFTPSTLVVRCICAQAHSPVNGAFLQCTSCCTVQHAACFGVSVNGPVPSDHRCHVCKANPTPAVTPSWQMQQPQQLLTATQ